MVFLFGFSQIPDWEKPCAFQSFNVSNQNPARHKAYMPRFMILSPTANAGEPEIGLIDEIFRYKNSDDFLGSLASDVGESNCRKYMQTACCLIVV
jgi:hypothetical protein